MPIKTTAVDKPLIEDVPREERIQTPGRLRIRLHTGSESFVQQSGKKDADINNLMARYAETGALPGIIQKNPEYGDFSNPVDYQEGLNIVLKAREQFDALPSPVRDRFQNDPAAFLAFAGDEKNTKEMATLGLLNEEAMAALKAQEAANAPKP